MLKSHFREFKNQTTFHAAYNHANVTMWLKPKWGLDSEGMFLHNLTLVIADISFRIDPQELRNRKNIILLS